MASPEPHEHEHQAGFDERAATWDEDPGHVARAEAVARTLIDTVDLEPDMRMLEYGAGTGLLTQAVRDRVGPVTLADVSSGMRDVIAAKIERGELTDARVWSIDLATEPAPTGEQFDLIVTVMTMHHIDPVDPVLGAFRDLLALGGHLCIVDLDREDGSFHGDGFVGHHGFDRAELTAALERAGLRSVRFTDCHTMHRDDAAYPIFLAVAQRPSSVPSGV